MIIREKSETSADFGSSPNNRPIDQVLKFGIINLDKPSGFTSSQVSGWVKQILHAKKTGHSGTLDPKVTGVLPVAIGRATAGSSPAPHATQ